MNKYLFIYLLSLSAAKPQFLIITQLYMPKSKRQKEEIVKNLNDKLNKSRSMVFIDYKGLKVKELDELRNECEKQGSEYFVAKKTLFNIAIQNRIENCNPKEMEGNLAIIVGYQDEVATAKIVKNFVKKYKISKILGGIVDNKYISENSVKNLANIPSKPELYSKLLGSFNAPVSGFINVFSGILRNFVGALDAIKESKANN